MLRGITVTLLVAGLLIGLTGLVVKFYALSRSLQAEIQARRTLEEELKALAITDSVTVVMNRRGLFQAIKEALAIGTVPLSLLIVDLDHFKRVNDTHGHAGGDHVLLEFARVCREIVRTGDAVGRLGGEEFAILLPGAGLDKARRIAERIRETMAHRVIALPRRGTVEVTVSVGLAVHRQLVQMYLEGGYVGENGLLPVRVEPGDICLLDLGRPLSTQTLPSRVLTVVMPRALLRAVAPRGFRHEPGRSGRAGAFGRSGPVFSPRHQPTPAGLPWLVEGAPRHVNALYSRPVRC